MTLYKMSNLEVQKRAHPRTDASIPASVMGESETQPQRALIEDIAPGGVRITTERLLTPQRIYTIQVATPQGEAVKIGAVVCYSSASPYSDSARSGLAFLAATDEERAAIIRFLNSVLRGRPGLAGQIPSVDPTGDDPGASREEAA